MIDIGEINKAITELENGSTSFAACQKLACLYLVREHLCSNTVVEEYKDILPSYKKYSTTKQKYKLGETTEAYVLATMNIFYKEIIEFLQVIYASTDFPEERQALFDKLNEFLLIYSST